MNYLNYSKSGKGPTQGQVKETRTREEGSVTALKGRRRTHVTDTLSLKCRPLVGNCKMVPLVWFVSLEVEGGTVENKVHRIYVGILL